ncbi:MAG: hypothetical protein ACLRFI_02900, partial [Alphaproteobacteria bacterium]
MKPSMIFALVLLTSIVIMSSFDIHMFGQVQSFNIPEKFAATGLYVCPVESSGWDSVANILRHLSKPLMIGVLFGFMMLIFAWAWGLYQNLLKDKFDATKFKTPWEFTKILFWVCVILLLATQTPNYFRRVHVRGLDGEYVLCEQNTRNSWPDVKDGKWPKFIT